MKSRSHPFIVIHVSAILILGLILGLGVSLWPAMNVRAASTIRVTSKEDHVRNDGACTLREAIIAANQDLSSGRKNKECQAGSGADVILLPPGRYTLNRTDNGKENSSSTGDLDITADVTIQAETSGVVIDAIPGFSDRIFHVLSGNASIQNVTISMGNVTGNGGGIYNAATLTLDGVTLSGNTASGNGGGIFNAQGATLNAANSEINGNQAGGAGGGVYNLGSLEISSSSVTGNTSTSGAGGLQTAQPGFVLATGNTIASNSGDGLRVASGSGNRLSGNSIFDNMQLGINLGEESITPNDLGDADVGPNLFQNYPVLIGAATGGNTINISGRLNSTPGTTFTLDFFANDDCDENGFGEGQDYLGSALISTDNTGNAYFQELVNASVSFGQFITATATDPSGNTSEFSRCIAASRGNDSWVNALPLNLSGEPLSASVEDILDTHGQSRWYKFNVQPNSKLVITLTNLPANYDLTLYKDIAQAFQTLQTPKDLERLGAEFAPDAFSPDAFSPDAFSPDAFSPDAFSPDAFSPDAFSPDAFSPDAFSPDAFSPDAFSPDAFSPDAFSPDAFSPDAFSPDAFSSAQLRSLIAVSAFEGNASEGILVNTWDNAGNFYLRVRGRNGVYNLNSSYHLALFMETGSCAGVSPITAATTVYPTAGGFRTIIISDIARMAGTAEDKKAMRTNLAALADRPEVAGVWVDVGTDPEVGMADARVLAANSQADANPACPSAKNMVASAIKAIIDGFWDLNPLEYVVLVGNDHTLAFFRHPDQSMLANERNYVPPVKDGTASQASLKLGYVLSQDRYGSHLDISLKEDQFPVPELAIGRLVEDPVDINSVLSAYLNTYDGVVQPGSMLVTGYDFLEDAAQSIQAELQAGIGVTGDSLISPRDLPPTDPSAWTADDLRQRLLVNRYDLAFLAGHFSANSALAADYTTRLQSTELLSTPENLLSNAIFFSAGCHSGYNIVDDHGVTNVTKEPDWAQAFASRGATLIAGTGYQYGDTDFLRYSERIYLEFARQLRTGSDPVSIGRALVAAKQRYLATTPYLRGIDEKAVLEATVFGLPMLRVDMPGERLPVDRGGSIVSDTTPVAQNPGATLGLQFADITVNPALTLHSIQLTDPADSSTYTANYLSGSAGVVSNPNEPVLPLEVSDVSVAGLALRGIGFRSGNYADLTDILPHTGAPATEIRGLHVPFLTNIFFPVQMWNANYFDALPGNAGGSTYLVTLPAQYQSATPTASTGTLRRFNNLAFRLYYSDNTAEFANGSVPALAAPPSITNVSANPGNGTVAFRVAVIGNPAAGVQEVWATYTAVNGPLYGQWGSLDLQQNSADTSIWEAVLTLPAGTAPQDVRYIVQATNGVGLVSLATNLGKYYTPGIDLVPSEPTAISIESSTSSGAYSTSAVFSALLTNNSAPLSGQTLVFSLGPQVRLAATDSLGRASVALPLFALPGETELRVSFAGTDVYQPSFATQTFTILKQSTQLTLDPTAATGFAEDPTLLTATLSDVGNRRLGEESVFFVVSGAGGDYAVAVITDFAGRAPLGDIPLTPGTYTVNAYFSGTIPLPGQSLTLEDDRYTFSSSDTGQLTLLNHAPVALDDAYSVDEDSILTVSAPGVLLNDSDLDEQVLTAVLVSGPSHGSLSLNSDGSFSYTPATNFEGSDAFTYKASDGIDDSSIATVAITINPTNDPPICSAAQPSGGIWIWPPDKTFVPVNVIGVTDLDGDPPAIVIDSIFQDERVGTDSNSPDGRGIGTSTAEVRAERDGSGNGRVYHIRFTASDAGSATCSGVIRVGVSDNQGTTLDPIDGGPLFDSTVPN